MVFFWGLEYDLAKHQPRAGCPWDDTPLYPPYLRSGGEVMTWD
jgi:hypothetical protein